MSNASIRRLIGGLGTLLVLLICGIVIWLSFYNGWNKQEIDVTKYRVIRSDGAGGYTAELDVDRLIREERLVNPLESELDRYPEIRVLRNLVYSKPEKQGDEYVLNLQILPGVTVEDPAKILNQAGIRLKNLESRVKESAMADAAQSIDVSRYTVIESDGKGGYTAKLDVDRMIPEEKLINPTEAELDRYPAIKVLKNLTCAVTQQGDGYTIALQIRPDVVSGDALEVLRAAGVKLVNVQQHYTAQQIAALTGETEQPQQQLENRQVTLDVSAYVRTQRAENGEYTAALDIYRMLTAAGIDPAADPETNVGAKALRSLGVSVQKEGDGYAFHTTSTNATVEDDLKAAEIRITNTRWTWTEAEAEQHRGTVTELPETGSKTKQLDFSSYVRTYKAENGDYGAKVDTAAMMRDMGVDPAADPETDVGAKALRSLGVSVQKEGDGFRFQTTSTLTTVLDDLKSVNIELANTEWTWTEAETAAHEGTVEPLPDPNGQTPTPSPESGAKPDPTPGTQPTTPATPAHDPNAIKTLYGFDQTEVRKAIRAAKEQKYGSTIESSEVKYNYFAVGNAAAEHANVFRLVYTITKSSGTEYLIADVYDLVGETGYTANDVHLSVTSDRNTARSTTDLSDYQVYTLNEGSMVFPENNGRSPFNSDGLVMPKSISESVSYDELWNIPATDDMTLLKLLGYARNEMFARGGHQFSDTSNYRKFYSQYSWYKPTGKVSADDLAKLYPATKKNISTIKFLEDLIKNG